MDKLIEMVKNYGQKDSNKVYYTVGIVILVLVLLYFLFRNGDYFGGNNTVTNQLNQITNTQREVTTGIKGAQDGITNIQRAVDRAEQSTTVIKGNLTTSRELIEDCQRILRRVQERNEVKK